MSTVDAAVLDRLMALWSEPWSEEAYGEAQTLLARIRAGVTLAPPASEPPADLRAALTAAGFNPDFNVCASCGHHGGRHDLGNWCLDCPRPDDWDRTAKSPTGAKTAAGWCFFGSMTDDEKWAHGVERLRAALSGDRPSPDHATPRGFPSHEADCHCHAAVARYAAVASPATAPAEGLDVERLAKALACEDPEEPCDADGRDEHRWCDYCIARSVVSRPAVAAEYARLAPDSAQEAE